MKKLVVAFVVLLALCGGTVGFAFYNANALIERYRPSLEQMASAIVGSDITFGPIDVGLFPNLKLVVDGVTVTSREDAGEALSLENLALHMKLFPLLRGRLEVTALSLEAPRIVVLIEEAGPRIAGLPREKSSAESDASATGEGEAPIAFNFESIAVHNGTLVLVDTAAKTEYVVSSFDMTTAVKQSQDGLRLEDMKVEAFSGTAGVNFFEIFEAPTPFTADVAIAGMSIKELTATLLPDLPLKLEGTLETLRVDVRGELADDPSPSVTGEIDFLLSDGLLQDINLAAKVLGAVDNIPFISGSLLKIVPKRLRDKMDRDYSPLKSVAAHFTVANEVLTTQDLKIRSDLFDLDATGTIGFDTEMDLEGKIYFSPGFCVGLTESVAAIAALFDSEGRLAFPLKISGTSENLRVRPDLKKLLKGVVKNAATKKVGEAIGGLLGGENEGEKKGLGGRLKGLVKR